MSTINTPNCRHAGTILLSLLLVPTGLYLDSISLTSTFPWGQTVLSIVMIAYFIVIYKKATRKFKKIMFYGLFIALFGEVLFSLILGMYEYRLHNIPIYVPPGHSVLLVVVYYFVREPWVVRNRLLIEKIMLIISITYGIFWLIFANDLYGFICLLVLLAICKYNKHYRLFFLSMYTMIAYIEQAGTIYGCWSWPEIAFDAWTWIPSGNPPSAISIFYFLFDIGCVKIYLRMHQSTRLRFKRYQAALQYN